MHNIQGMTQWNKTIFFYLSLILLNPSLKHYFGKGYKQSAISLVWVVVVQ